MEITNDTLRCLMALASVGGGFKTTEKSNNVFIGGTGNIAVSVTFDEELPAGISIMDTSKLVRLIKMVNGKSLTWGNSSVVIAGARGEATLTYCMPDIVGDQLAMPDDGSYSELASFNLTKDDFALLTNGMFDHVVIEVDGIVKCTAKDTLVGATVEPEVTDISSDSVTLVFHNMAKLIHPEAVYASMIMDMGEVAVLSLEEAGVRYFVTNDVEGDVNG